MRVSETTDEDEQDGDGASGQRRPAAGCRSGDSSCLDGDRSRQLPSQRRAPCDAGAADNPKCAVEGAAIGASMAQGGMTERQRNGTDHVYLDCSPTAVADTGVDGAGKISLSCNIDRKPDLMIDGTVDHISCSSEILDCTIRSRGGRSSNLRPGTLPSGCIVSAPDAGLHGSDMPPDGPHLPLCSASAGVFSAPVVVQNDNVPGKTHVKATYDNLTPVFRFTPKGKSRPRPRLKVPLPRIITEDSNDSNCFGGNTSASSTSASPRPPPRRVYGRGADFSRTRPGGDRTRQDIESASGNHVMPTKLTCCTFAQPQVRWPAMTSANLTTTAPATSKHYPTHLECDLSRPDLPAAGSGGGGSAGRAELCGPQLRRGSEGGQCLAPRRTPNAVSAEPCERREQTTSADLQDFGELGPVPWEAAQGCRPTSPRMIGQEPTLLAPHPAASGRDAKPGKLFSSSPSAETISRPVKGTCAPTEPAEDRSRWSGGTASDNPQDLVVVKLEEEETGVESPVDNALMGYWRHDPADSEEFGVSDRAEQLPPTPGEKHAQTKIHTAAVF